MAGALVAAGAVAPVAGFAADAMGSLVAAFVVEAVGAVALAVGGVAGSLRQS